MRAAAAQMAVTSQPVREKLLRMRSSDVPVLRKKLPKTLISISSISPE